MPRDSSGNYTLPAGNPVVDGTIIESVWANTTLSDLAVQMNNIFTRDGLLGPTAPILFVNGSVALPGIAFAQQPSSGFYRLPPDTVGVSIAGVSKQAWSASGTTIAGPLTFTGLTGFAIPGTDITLDDNKLIKWGDGTTYISGNATTDIFVIANNNLESLRTTALNRTYVGGDLTGLGRTERLQVYGSALTWGDNQGLRVLNAAASGAGGLLAATGANGGITVTGDLGPINFIAGNASRMRLEIDGKVNIGTAVPGVGTSVNNGALGVYFSETLVSGIVGGGSGIDGFTEGGRFINHYGLTWKTYGGAGPNALLSGYGGIRFYTLGAFAGAIDTLGSMVLHGGALTLKDTHSVVLSDGSSAFLRGAGMFFQNAAASVTYASCDGLGQWGFGQAPSSNIRLNVISMASGSANAGTGAPNIRLAAPAAGRDVNIAFTDGSVWNSYIGAAGNGDIYFGVSNAASFAEKLRITSALVYIAAGVSVTCGNIAASATTPGASLEVRNNSGVPGADDMASIQYHCVGQIGTKLGLRPDNYFILGGWTAPATRWYVQCATGDMTAAGNVIAYSDERHKKDWAPLADNFVQRLADVRMGTFTRTDNGQRQVGVGAQSLRPLLPEAIVVGADGDTLGISYGHAALAACVELAREVVKLRKLIQRGH